jgi:CheY-like chemotaxis protein
MNYLLIEDGKEKANSIIGYLKSLDDAAKIDHVDNLADARIRILTSDYDLVIFDIYLPLTRGQNEQDVSDEILADFAKSRNYHSEAISLTKYSTSDNPSNELEFLTTMALHWLYSQMMTINGKGASFKKWRRYDPATFGFYCLLRTRKGAERIFQYQGYARGA